LTTLSALDIISRGVKKPERRRISYIISASVGDEKFEGSGSTYKVAKSAAAVVALKALFNLDFQPDPNHKGMTCSTRKQVALHYLTV